MKIIFLDIDGVLAPIPRPFDKDGFNPSCVIYFESVFRHVPDSSIVISSTWRIAQTVDQLRKTMGRYGLSCSERIIGKTVDYTETGELLYLTRGQEISMWLMDNKEVDSYVIVDDDTDISPHQNRWVQPRHELGFQKNDAENCVNILKSGLTQGK